MTFVYDVYVNFQPICYDFYEWNKQDKISHVKKIPIFQIEDSIFQSLLIHDCILDQNTFHLIFEKTEVYKQKKKLSAVLFTNNRDILALLLDDDGKVIKKSFLLLEEENTILKSIRKVDFLKIAPIQLSKKVPPLETREEKEKRTFLLKEVKEMEDSQLIYLYFECFGKREENRIHIEKTLIDEIQKGNKEIEDISYNFLKLICNK